MKYFTILSALILFSNFCASQTKKLNDTLPKQPTSSVSRYTATMKYLGKSSATEMGLYKDEITNKWFFIDETGDRHYECDLSSLTESGYWNLEGNTGTDTTGNFLGTTDSMGLFIKTNNVARLKINADGNIRMPGYINRNLTDSVLTTDSTGKITFTNVGQSNILVLDSISNIYTYFGSKSLIFVKDSVRGGFFYKYAGALAVDSGMILKDSSGNKWKRYVTDNRIRPEWYGASTELADNYAPFMKAINYIYATNNHVGTTIAPYGSSVLQLSGVRYNFSQTLIITNHIKIEGQGTRYEPTSLLYFPANIAGMKFVGNFSADMKNIMVGQAYGTDSAAHGISISCIVNFENVVVNFAGGNGINIDACGYPGSPNYGSSDGSIFLNCKVQNCNNGVFVNGCDANQMVFQSLWAVANRRWGIYDNGFLGNHYYNPQCDYNGNNESVVTYGSPTKYYLALQPEDSININQQPDAINSSYWKEVGPRAATAWNSGKKYYTGGAYAIVNINAYSTVYGAYSEEGEAPALLNNRTITIGGDQGSGVVGGKYFLANNDGLLLNSNFILTGGNRLGVGIAPYYPLDVDYSYTNSSINSIARFKCEDCESTNLSFNNSTNTLGVIGYQNRSFLVVADSKSIIRIDTTGVIPVVDSHVDLGNSSLKWNNVFANRWRGGVIEPSYGGSGLSSLNPYTVLTGGTTSTGNLQQVSGTGTSGQILTSNGAGALPTWQDPSGGSGGGTNWSISGNSISSGSFIGTTNNQDVVFKRNNTIAGLISDAPYYTTAFGTEALNNNTTGFAGTAFGWRALYSNTSGSENTAMGMQALLSNTTGSYNMAMGTVALEYNTTGSYNVAIGRQSLWQNTTGGQNVAIGNESQISSTGSQNTSIGVSTLANNTTGAYNTTIGYQGLFSNATGNYNVSIGNIAGSNLTTGDNNIFIGYNTQPASTTGSNQLNIGSWIKGNNGNILIGTGTTINASAQLELNSTTKGFLPSRMTTTERDSIGSPAEGLIIYNTTTHKLNVFTGSAWEQITSN